MNTNYIYIIFLIILSLFSLSSFIIYSIRFQKNKITFDNDDNVNVHIITLMNDKKRLTHVKKITTKHNFIELFPAVDKNDTERINQLFKEFNFKINSGNPGMIGCYLSHLIIIHNFLQSNKKYQIILEDDIKILRRLPKNITQIENLFKTINQSSKNIDILYINNRVNFDKNFRVNGGCGTDGYILTRHGAEKIYKILLNDCNTEDTTDNMCAIDMILQAHFKFAKENNWCQDVRNLNKDIIINAYAIDKPIVDVYNFDSNIGYV